VDVDDHNGAVLADVDLLVGDADHTVGDHPAGDQSSRLAGRGESPAGASSNRRRGFDASRFHCLARRGRRLTARARQAWASKDTASSTRPGGGRVAVGGTSTQRAGCNEYVSDGVAVRATFFRRRRR
jgi:hypothetical protein